jgi:hypothetical protein
MARSVAVVIIGKKVKGKNIDNIDMKCRKKI